MTRNRLPAPPLRLDKGFVRGWGMLSTLYYKLYNNDLIHLLESLRARTTIGHIDCSCPTCADNVTLLANFLVCLQLLLVVVKFFICRGHKFINSQKLTEVELNKVACCERENQMHSLGWIRFREETRRCPWGRYEPFGYCRYFC